MKNFYILIIASLDNRYVTIDLPKLFEMRMLWYIKCADIQGRQFNFKLLSHVNEHSFHVSFIKKELLL